MREIFRYLSKLKSESLDMIHEVISYAWAKFQLKIFISLGNKCKKPPMTWDLNENGHNLINYPFARQLEFLAERRKSSDPVRRLLLQLEFLR